MRNPENLNVENENEKDWKSELLQEALVLFGKIRTAKKEKNESQVRILTDDLNKMFKEMKLSDKAQDTVLEINEVVKKQARLMEAEKEKSPEFDALDRQRAELEKKLRKQISFVGRINKAIHDINRGL